MRGLCGPRVNEEPDLCRKTERIAFKMLSPSQLPDTEIPCAQRGKRLPLTHLLYHTRFFCFQMVKISVCACEGKNNHTTLSTSLTWMSDSLSLSSSTSSTMSRISS